MKPVTAGATAGLVAGAVISGVLKLGSDAGVLKDDLGKTTEDWLEDRFGARRRLGAPGAQALEQGGHYLASLGFGVVYAKLRPLAGFLPGVAAGGLFGAGLYALGVAGVLPELGVTDGERKAPDGVPTERFLTHVLYGAVLGLVADGLTDRRAEVAQAD